MTTETTEQTIESAAAPVAPQHVPCFNILIVDSEDAARAFAKHYDLSPLEFLNAKEDSFPAGGLARNQALRAFMAKKPETVYTFVVVLESIWLHMLARGGDQAGAVWRNVESALLGHETDTYRNMIVYQVERGATNVIKGMALPHGWKRPKKEVKPAPAKKEAPKVEQPKKDGKKKDKATKPQSNSTNATSTIKPGVGLSQAKGRQERQDRPYVPARGTSYRDLIRLAKGNYGPINAEGQFLEKARVIIETTTGVSRNVLPKASVIRHVFDAYVAFESRERWNRFGFLQKMVERGAESPDALLGELVASCQLIHAPEGHELREVNNFVVEALEKI